MPEYQHHPEVGLFMRFSEGDPAAADQVFLLYVKPLCAYVERLTGSVEDARDITADTFIQLLERRQQFREMDHVRAFLYRVARNSAINRLREQSRHMASHAEAGYLADLGETERFDNEQIRAEVLGEIYREIEELPGRCREIVKGLFVEGLTAEQVAARMGIEVQTVRSQKARAIQLLRTQLLKKGHLVALVYLLQRLLEN